MAQPIRDQDSLEENSGQERVASRHQPARVSYTIAVESRDDFLIGSASGTSLQDSAFWDACGIVDLNACNFFPSG